MTMSASPPIKETILPPPSPLSYQSHRSQLSPHLLTPDSDAFSRTPTPGLDALCFAKQPIPLRRPQAASLYYPSTESEMSDGHISEVPMHGGGGSGSRPHSPKAQHLSLLSAILSSPDNGSKPSLHRAEFKRAPSGPNGMISGSSNPSTTMSSPAAREPHGILQNAQAQAAAVAKADAPPSSILRRESLGPVEEANVQAAAGSGVGLGLGFGAGGPAGGQEGYNGLDGLAGRLEKVEERRERIGWADKVEKQSPVSTNLARVPSTGSSIGPRPRLQFAVAHPPSHGSTSASEAGDIVGRRHSTTTNTSHRPTSPFAKERKVQESLDELNSDEDEEEEEGSDDDTPLEEVPRLYGYNSRSTSSSGRRSEELQSPIAEEEDDDLGYQEDEEDGMFSDEEETAAFDLPGDMSKRKFAFARPTNYFRGRRPSRDDMSPGTTPPPAPSFFPPPNRRGRGHVRVADPAPTLSVDKAEKKGCSRHCSPPPSSRSRSGSKVEPAPPAIASPSARFMRRPEKLAVAGPSKQRIVGSPMPPRVFVTSDEDEDDEDENEEEEDEVEAEDGEEDGERDTPPVVRGGWRSDDAVFYGPGARVASRAIRPYDPHVLHTSAPIHQPAVFEDESADDQSFSASMAREASMDAVEGGGVRQWIRRASEQIPMFRRPSNAMSENRPDGAGRESPSASGRSRDVSYTAPIPCQATLQPALDNTPVVGASFSKHGELGLGLASRLEQTLSAGLVTPTSSNTSPAPAMSRDPTASSTASSAVHSGQPSTPSSRPVSAGQSAEPLNRAVSMSNRVTFRPAEKPVRVAAPQRAVSSAPHHLPNKERCISAGGISGGTVQAIKCPKRATGAGEDLGWSDEALMSIRRKAGKGE